MTDLRPALLRPADPIATAEAAATLLRTGYARPPPAPRPRWFRLLAVLEPST